MQVELTFRLRNTTKGAVRYQETQNGQEVSGDDAVVGGLYLRKAALAEPYPALITVTIKG